VYGQRRAQNQLLLWRNSLCAVEIGGRRQMLLFDIKRLSSTELFIPESRKADITLGLQDEWNVNLNVAFLLHIFPVRAEVCARTHQSTLYLTNWMLNAITLAS
jgi:hypothetical protein